MSGDLKLCAETVLVEKISESRITDAVEQRGFGQFNRRGGIADARSPAVGLFDMEGARSTAALGAGRQLQSIGTLHGGTYHAAIHARIEYINKKVISIFRCRNLNLQDFSKPRLNLVRRSRVCEMRDEFAIRRHQIHER